MKLWMGNLNTTGSTNMACGTETPSAPAGPAAMGSLLMLGSGRVIFLGLAVWEWLRHLVRQNPA